MYYREVVLRRFSPEKIVEVWQRLRNGQSVRSVAIGLGRYPSTVRQMVMRSGGVPPLVVKSRGAFFKSLGARRDFSCSFDGRQYSTDSA